MALLPVDKIPKAWKYLKGEMRRTCTKEKELENFIDYNENTYINCKDGKGLKLEDWNFYRDAQRTQNIIERRHKEWLRRIGHHPWILPFLRFLQKVDALTMIRTGQLMKHGKTRWKDRNEREKEYQLDNLWTLLENDTIDIACFLKWSALAIGKHWEHLDKYYEEYDLMAGVNCGDYYNTDQVIEIQQ